LAKPLIFFGAFDRHNFGDLLFPHVAAALLPERTPLYAGLANRDLRAFGGHAVEALPSLLSRIGDTPVSLIHVGGEILTCDAWEAAIMLLPDEAVQAVVARLDACPRERIAWAVEQLGIDDAAPYVVSGSRLNQRAAIVLVGVGGVALESCPPRLRAEVLVKLATANAVAVRDRHTLAQLERAGVAAALVPDPAVMVAELFRERIEQARRKVERERIRTAFPRGYLAIQFSADFADDATLGQLASELGRAARSTGLGLVLFRAGAAPWHDTREGYERLAARLSASTVRIFDSLDIWDICALIAGSQGYCGSSLHGRIVATAFALPRINLLHPNPGAHSGKTAAFAATWDEPDMPGAVELHEIERALYQAMAVDRERLRALAVRLARQYRAGLAAVAAPLR
jgi:hypothetical protein